MTPVTMSFYYYPNTFYYNGEVSHTNMQPSSSIFCLPPEQLLGRLCFSKTSLHISQTALASHPRRQYYLHYKYLFNFLKTQQHILRETTHILEKPISKCSTKLNASMFKKMVYYTARLKKILPNHSTLLVFMLRSSWSHILMLYMFHTIL